jgi:hypothetical protein
MSCLCCQRRRGMAQPGRMLFREIPELKRPGGAAATRANPSHCFFSDQDGPERCDSRPDHNLSAEAMRPLSRKALDPHPRAARASRVALAGVPVGGADSRRLDAGSRAHHLEHSTPPLTLSLLSRAIRWRAGSSALRIGGGVNRVNLRKSITGLVVITLALLAL